jgi:hypothetical protein
MREGIRWWLSIQWGGCSAVAVGPIFYVPHMGASPYTESKIEEWGNVV